MFPTSIVFTLKHIHSNQSVLKSLLFHFTSFRIKAKSPGIVIQTQIAGFQSYHSNFWHQTALFLLPSYYTVQPEGLWSHPLPLAETFPPMQLPWLPPHLPGLILNCNGSFWVLVQNSLQGNFSRPCIIDQVLLLCDLKTSHIIHLQQLLHLWLCSHLGCQLVL